MNIKNFIETVSYLPPHIAVLMRASTGVGKSALVNQISQNTNLPLIDVRASIMSEGDVAGYPDIESMKKKGVMTFCMPSWFVRACNEPVILFLDELNRGLPAVQQSFFQIVLDRQLGNDADGNPYKIYQPLKKKHKFHKLAPYIQGLDQLEYNQPYLVICSSLKDAMCLMGFGYNIEVIAPDSENTIIKPYLIENLKTKYKSIITLFDNDDAGKKAIEKYRERYGINGTCLSLSKDISDSIREYGFEKTHSELKPLLKQALNRI